jgi:transcriptional regulator with XRE-family HTH domain
MGNRIKEKREAMNLSQVRLAQICQIPAPMLSDFENGKRLPYPKARRALALALNTSEEELFGEEVKDA